MIVNSIECAKQLIRKLDNEQELDGLSVILNNFSPNDIIANPESVLDQLILYLFCVHRVDWYSEKWEMMRGDIEDKLSVRPDPSIVVLGSVTRDAAVSSYIARMEHRTEAFLQVWSIVALKYQTYFTLFHIFTESAHWANSVIESACPSVCMYVCL